MNQRNLKETPALLKAIEIERQLVNIALYNYKSAQMLCDIHEDEFIRKENKEIRRAILSLLCENSKPSVTIIANKIPSSLKKYFIDLAVEQFYGDFDSLYIQFKKVKKLAKSVGIHSELLNYAANGQTEQYDLLLAEAIDYHYSEDVIEDATKMADVMNKSEKEIYDSVKRIKNPIPSLAEFIPEFRGGQYVCIAGSPGMGKTTAALILAEKIPDSLFISYEMDKEELHDIIISRYTGIDSALITNNTLDWNQKQKVEIARRNLRESLTLRVQDKPIYANDLFSYIRRMVRKYGIQCVVIDYAQIIPGLPAKGTKTEAYENLSRKFKQVAREEGILLIALSQLNKDSLTEKRAPQLNDLRGSLSFGQDADTVLFFYGTPTDKLGTIIPSCSVGKQRKGRIGKVHNFKYIKKIHLME